MSKNTAQTMRRPTSFVHKIFTLTNLRRDPKTVYKEMERNEVVITQRNRAPAVLVYADRWNQINTEVRDLRLTVAALESLLDKDPLVDFEEVEAAKESD